MRRTVASTAPHLSFIQIDVTEATSSALTELEREDERVTREVEERRAKRAQREAAEESANGVPVPQSGAGDSPVKSPVWWEKVVPTSFVPVYRNGGRVVARKRKN